MKYNQPFDQPSNPNAPYVDGNPSAGIQGSIVPAASIEYPQREIVAAVQAAGLTPSNDDLGQLIKFVKCVDVFNIFKSAVNQGNASQWSVTIPALPTMPPPLGTALWIKPGYDSVNGGTVLSVNGGAFAAVVHADLSPVTISDIIPTGWLLVFFDGSRWQIVAGGSTRVPGLLPALTANANWFVNGTTGSDTVYDGTWATVASATKGPFKTIQRAASETAKYNMNGYNQSINVADGAYANATMPSTNGVGTVFVYGNPASPQNCTVTNSGGGSALVMNAGGSFDVNGFRLAGGLDGLDVQSTGTHCACRNLRFGACGRAHLVVSNGANLVLNDGVFIIEA